MRNAVVILSAVVGLMACDTGKFAVNSTAKVLNRGKYATKQEPDYILASRAIPGSLKTVEAFHMVNPENRTLTLILAEGFCQYSTAFIEDEWEMALLDKDYELAEEISKRASKSFMRCLGYSLHALGSGWKKAIEGSKEDVEARVKKAGMGQRDYLMWAAAGLGGTINHNKGNPELLANLPKVEALINRVIELDDKHNQKDVNKRATAHVIRAMIYMGLPEQLGGKVELGKQHFERAIEITENKYLLPKVLMAKKYAVAKQDKAMFRKLLVEVLQTDPAIWPQQRLANEVAHRRARRYLKQEKDLF